MLPPGHFAGGYLATLAVMRVFDVPVEGNEWFFAFGLFASIAPDFDFLVAFSKTRSLTIDTDRANHRKYYSHRPFVWFALCVPFFLHGSNDVRLLAALLFAGTWTHFLLDSIQYGVMWLWPFSNKLYAFCDAGKDMKIADHRFLPFWRTFALQYARDFRVSASSEVALIICAVAFFFSFGRMY